MILCVKSKDGFVFKFWGIAVNVFLPSRSENILVILISIVEMCANMLFTEQVLLVWDFKSGVWSSLTLGHGPESFIQTKNVQDDLFFAPLSTKGYSCSSGAVFSSLAAQLTDTHQHTAPQRLICCPHTKKQQSDRIYQLWQQW